MILERRGSIVQRYRWVDLQREELDGYANIIGGYNTAIGTQALRNNTGDGNTATGFLALGHNSTGIYNTAIGYEALFTNTTGSSNTATGHYAMLYPSGSANTAYGCGALFGYSATCTRNNNTAVGKNALVYIDSDNNTAIGCGAGANCYGGGSGGNVYLGYNAGPAVAAAESNKLYIANNSLASG
jgi:hypothetical protein